MIVFPISMFGKQEKGKKMAISLSSFRSLVLFLLEQLLLPLVEISFPAKYELVNTAKLLRAISSTFLKKPFNIFLSFLLDSLCFMTMYLPGTQLLTSYFKITGFCLLEDGESPNHQSKIWSLPLSPPRKIPPPNFYSPPPIVNVSPPLNNSFQVITQ